MFKRLLVSTLALFVLFGVIAPTNSLASWKNKTKTMSETRYDLDGDGKKDKITVVFDEYDGYSYRQFTFKIANQVLTRRGDSIQTKIFVVDINKNDPRKMVMICDAGPSDDPSTFSFMFDYGMLFDIGKLEGNLLNTRDAFKVNGDGTITTPVRGSKLQTWWHKVTYRFNEWEMRFDMIKQKTYDSTSDYPVMVKKSFKVYSDMNTESKAYTLNKGEIIIINGTDDNKWVRSKNSMGKLAWILLEETGAIDDAGRAEDYLDGLEFFD